MQTLGSELKYAHEALAKCRLCGKCCRHTIIDDVYVTDLIREPKLIKHCKEFPSEPGRYRLLTPCPFLKNSKCSIYPTRPQICVSALPGENYCCPVEPIDGPEEI